jgi:hypothetical protein
MKNIVGTSFSSAAVQGMNVNDQEADMPESLAVSGEAPDPLFGTHIRETVETIMNWIGRR